MPTTSVELSTLSEPNTIIVNVHNVCTKLVFRKYPFINNLMRQLVNYFYGIFLGIEKSTFKARSRLFGYEVKINSTTFLDGHTSCFPVICEFKFDCSICCVMINVYVTFKPVITGTK